MPERSDVGPPLVRWLRARFDIGPAGPDEARLIGEAHDHLRDHTKALMAGPKESVAPDPSRPGE